MKSSFLLLALALAGTSLNAQTVIPTGAVGPGAPASWDNQTSVIVGDNGIGTLTLAGSGTATMGRIYIGAREHDSLGTVTVSGHGSLLIVEGPTPNDSSIAVGHNHAGILTIEAGGQVRTSGESYIGHLLGSGTATVTGDDSRWDTGGGLSVGLGNTGSLTIADGGVVTSGAGLIGLYSHSLNNVVTVTGEGSTWTNSRELTVGEEGTATLDIEEGGQVSAATVHLGRSAGGSGVVNVRGTGSLLSTTEDIYVGGGGYGELNLSGGATVTAGGALRFRTWYSQLNIGSYDQLNPTTGGTLNTSSLFLGGETYLNFNQTDTFVLDADVSGRGMLTQRGTGTTVITGTVSPTNITNTTGGTVVKVERGTLKVSGAQASIDTPSYGMTVYGGTLAVDGGAAVRTSNLTIDSEGHVRVSGNSTLQSGQWLYVASGSVGAMTIESGGKVSMTNNAFTFTLGSSNGAHGTLTIDQGELSLLNELQFGDGGRGTMLFQGGTITNTIGNIARSVGSVGDVTMNGGTWSNSNLLVVGNAGIGTLTQNGGSITNTDGEIGRNGGGSGIATINGGTWTNSGNLYIAKGGNGTLTLTGTGQVAVNGGTTYLAYGSSTAGTLNFGAYDLAAPTTAGTLATANIAFGSGSGAIHFNQSNTLTLASAISGAGWLVQRGTGTTILTGVSTLTGGNVFTGITTVKQGTLAVEGTGASLTQASSAIFVGDTSGDNGTFLVSDGALVASARAYIGVRNGAQGTATVSGAGSRWETTNDIAVGYQGVGTLNLLSGGTVSAPGKTLYIGYNSGSAGTLNFGAYNLHSPTTAGALDMPAIHLGPSTATIHFNQTNALTLGATISGHGTLVQRGTGTTLLTAASTFSGSTQVLGGTLKLSDVGTGHSVLGTSAVFVGSEGTLTGNGWILGDTSTGGTLAVGDTTGLMSFASDLTLMGTSNLLMELGGTSRGATFDAIRVGGDLILDGTLTISFVNGFAPIAGDTFHLFEVDGTTSSAFTSIVFTASGYTAQLNTQTGMLSITSSAIPEPSTYAAIAGAMAIGWAAWRRRKGLSRTHAVK